MSTKSSSSTATHDPDTHIALHRKLAQHLPGTGILFFDQDLRFFMAEGDALAVQGFTRERVEGKTLFEVLPEGDARDRLEASYRAALQGEQTAYTSQYKDSYYSTTIIPVTDDEGHIFAGMVVARDITAQKESEAVLIENAQRLNGLFNRSNDAIFFLELDGTISGCNTKACRMLGYSEGELIGTKPDRYAVNPTEDHTQAQVVALIRGEDIPNYVRRFQRNDGATFYGEVSTALIRDGNGNPSHMQSVIRDVTWRVETEEALTARVDQLTTLRAVDEELAERLDVDYVATMALDSVMRLTAAAAGFIGLLGDHGIIQVAKMVGSYPAREEAERHLSQGIGVVGQAVATGRAQHAPNTRKEPVYVPLRERTGSQIAVPLVSRDTLIGVLNVEDDRIGWFTDEMFDMVKLIASRIATAIDNARLYKQTESQLEQLRSLYDQLSDLEQLKSDMIRIASHDLRNPLSAVQGYMQLMEMEMHNLPENMREMFADYIAQMSGSAKHMEKIIIDILSLERIQEQGHLEHEVFDITDVINSVVEANQTPARLTQKQLTFNHPDEPVLVHGDAVHMREAIENLVNNAVKYTRSGGSVRVKLCVEKDLWMTLTVEDDGLGIPAEDQEKLFQPFYRARNVKERIEGTGLGLYLVKNIIERHDGRLTFISEENVGTTFTMRLPITFT